MTMATFKNERSIFYLTTVILGYISTKKPATREAGVILDLRCVMLPLPSTGHTAAPADLRSCGTPSQHCIFE
jgi:hypothetical protein